MDVHCISVTGEADMRDKSMACGWEEGAVHGFEHGFERGRQLTADFA